MNKKIIAGILCLCILCTSVFAMQPLKVEASWDKPSTGCWGFIVGTNVSFRSSAQISSSNFIDYLKDGEKVAIEVFDSGTASGYQWSKITRIDGKTGYVASTYLRTEGKP